MRKFVTVVLIILFLSVALFESTGIIYFTRADTPTKLILYTNSPNVLADNSTYQCVLLQLQDVNGKISRATQDITVGLSSSLVTIGTVDSLVIIHAGETYALANFTSTFYPGTTTISASATGFSTVYSTITTLGPIPSAIGVYGFPSTLPSDGESYQAIVVQLQDSTNTPARAPPGGLRISLTCSDTMVGTVTESVQIAESETYVIANFSTTTNAQTQGRMLSTTITATANGYAPAQTTITTSPIAANATKLKLFTASPKVLADHNSYRLVAVQLQNVSGFVAKSSEDIIVNLASNDSSVCQISSITIPEEHTFALATLNTTYKPGTASLAAVANNFAITNQTITSFGFIASLLTVYGLPSNIPADGNTYESLQVQLQDTQGRPAINTGIDLNVKLFSSQPNVAVVSSTIIIPSGRSIAASNITTTYNVGSTTITAQASGYTTGQTSLTTSLIDSLTISTSCGPNGSIMPNGTISVNLGCNQRFNVTANTGYHILDLAVDGDSQGTLSTYTFTNVTRQHMVFATFAINRYNIVVTQTANGRIDPGTSLVSYGDKPIFTITPNEGYFIANITANGQSIPVNASNGQTYQFGAVTANGSLTSGFSIKKVIIQINQSANGNISPGTTVLNYAEGKTFSIAPKTGYHVVDVIVNGTSVGAADNYTITNVTGDTTLSATFAANPIASPTPTPTATPEATPTRIPVTPSPRPASTVRVLTDDGSTVTMQINGNITSEQITNAALTNNGTAVILSFTLTGPNGEEGSGNITIPKGAIGHYGATPIIYIDNQPSENQVVSQDDNYYYVWFSTHYSSHEISIEFSALASTSQALPQNLIYALVGLVALAISSVMAFIYIKKIDVRAKLSSILR